MTVGRGLLAAALAVILIGLAGGFGALWLIRSEFLDACQNQLGRTLGLGPGNACVLEVHKEGVVLGLLHLESPQHQISIDRVTVTLSWEHAPGAAAGLLMRRVRPLELPWQWDFAGGLWRSEQTGRIEWQGGTTHPVSFDSKHPSRAGLDFSYRLVDHPLQTAGTLKGTLFFEPGAHRGGRSDVTCSECVLEVADVAQRFSAKVSWQNAGQKGVEPEFVLSLPDFVFALPGRWMLRDPVPPALAGLRASLALKHVPVQRAGDVVSEGGVQTTAPSTTATATTRLSVEKLSGELGLDFAHDLLGERLEEALGARCTSDDRGPGKTSPGIAPESPRQSRALMVCGFLREALPRSAKLSQGEASVQLDWHDNGLANLQSHWSGVALGTAAQKVVTLRLKGHNDALSGADSRTRLGNIRLEEPSLGHVDLVWSVSSESPQATSRAPAQGGGDLWAHRFNALTRLRSEVSLSQAEAQRLVQVLLNRLVSEAARSLGLPEHKGAQISLPDEAALKDIEREGKAWLKNKLDEGRSGDSAVDREQRRRQRRESEKKLKEALGRILGQ